MKTLAILLAMAATACGQTVYYVDCQGGMCYPGQQCQPQYQQYSQPYSQPQRQYQPPRQQQFNPQISPDGQATPSVGSPGTPKFTPQPQVTPEKPNNPALPTPPQPQTPVIDPQISKDLKVLIEGQSKTADALTKLAEAMASQKGCECKCEPVNLKPVLDRLDDLDRKVDGIGAVTPEPPKPPVTPPAPPTTQIPAVEEHVVVVADHNAPYWQRLSSTLESTRKTYSGIQDVTLPPFAIGTHPQAIVYRNGTPIRIARNLYEVENLLSRLARGESI